MQLATGQRQPGGIEEVNAFLRKAGRGAVLPLVRCSSQSCTTLISQKKETLLLISPKGESSHKRICKACIQEKRDQGYTVL